MATSRGSEAYDYRRYASAGSAVPAARPRPSAQPGYPRPHVVRKTKRQLRAETRRSRAAAIKIMSVALVCFTLIVFQIYSKVRVDELDRQLASVNKEISVIQSDNTRLNMELDADVSLDKVDDYARNVLGMVKAQDYQVNYVKTAGQDNVEVSGGKQHRTLFERIKTLFN